MKNLILAAAAFVLLSAPALAQTATSSSGSSAGIYAPNNSINIPSKSLKTTGNAIGPSLAAAGLDNCAGSVSGSVGVLGLGVGFGSTYTMTPCDIRAMARALDGLGQRAAAIHYMAAQDEKLKASLAATGAIVLTGPQTAQAAPRAAYAAASTAATPRPVAPGKPAFCSDPRSYSPALCN